MTMFSALRAGLLTLFAAAFLLTTAQAQTLASSSGSGSSFSPNAAPGETGGDAGAGIFGTLPFKLSFSVRGGYDDNVSTSNQFKQGSPFTETGLTAIYDFGDSRTHLNLQVGAAFTYYYDNIHSLGLTSNQYDIDTSVRLNVTHKISPRMTLTSDVFIGYLSEPDFSIAQGVNYRSGNYFFTQDKFTLNYLWAPRFSTATSYTLGGIRYDESSIGFYSNRVENTFGNEFRFLLAPTTTVVGEYRFQLISYQDIDRDSRTHYLLGGFDHTFDPRLTLSLRGGAEFRNYDPDDITKTGPYFESTLNYAVAKQTTVSWTARYGLEESDLIDVQDRTTFRTGLTAKHDFTPKISGSVGAYYEHDDYHSVSHGGVILSPSFTEQSADVSLNVRYAFTRYFWVEAGYDHSDVWSDFAAREYTRNRFWGGLSVTF